MARKAALTAAVVLAALLLLALVGTPAAGSPTPTGVCPVCGQTFHENVTASDATLQMETDGDVRWRVENEVAEPTATKWKENPEMAEQRVQEVIHREYRHPYQPTDLNVTFDGDTLVIEFVDRDAARQRLDLLILPYLHGEGVQYRWVINADTFTVEAPAGHRVVNEPDGATVEDGRVVWSGVAATDDGIGLWDAPEPDNTYVVTGAGVTAGARASVAVPLEPLDPGLYAIYTLGLLFVLGLALGVYSLLDARLGRRRTGAAVGLIIAGHLAVVVAFHPLPAGGLEALAARVMLTMSVLLVGLFGAFGLYVATVIAGKKANA